MERREISYWPPMLDLLASTLMVFLLITYLQDVLSTQELEGVLIRQQQIRFSALAEQQLAREIALGSVALKRQRNTLVITFSDRVLFPSGGHRLRRGGQELLVRCREMLVQAVDIGYDLVQVEGHTDSIPLRRTEYPANNWQLSAARAIRVVELLAEEPRLDAQRLAANGYADTRPVAKNESEEGRALNRRIEMRIFFTGSEPSLALKESENIAGKTPAGAAP